MSDIGGYTNDQVDAILDVIDGCRLVSREWDSCKNLGSLLVIEARERLDDVYIYARELGVEDEVLIRLVCRNCPEPILNTMPAAA